MNPRLAFDASPARLMVLLDAYTKLAVDQLAAAIRAGRPLPPLYRSGVRYARELPGHEDWQLPRETLRRRRGDCEDLSIWRAAEYRISGEPAAPFVYWSGPHRLHVIVRTRWHFEDPSALLGM